MAIAGAAKSRVGSPLGIFARPLKAASAKDLPFAGPPFDIGEEERTFAVTSA
jgi:hypothetical protein